MSKNQISKNGTIERTVEGLRNRFNDLLKKCGGSDRLAKRLSEFDSYFNESNGIYDVANAKLNKAGETAMLRILAAMEQLAARNTPTSSRVEKSLQKMGIAYEPKYQATKDLQTKMKASKK